MLVLRMSHPSSIPSSLQNALDAVELAAPPTTLADLRFPRNIQDYQYLRELGLLRGIWQSPRRQNPRPDRGSRLAYRRPHLPRTLPIVLRPSLALPDRTQPRPDISVWRWRRVWDPRDATTRRCDFVGDSPRPICGHQLLRWRNSNGA